MVISTPFKCVQFRTKIKFELLLNGLAYKQKIIFQTQGIRKYYFAEIFKSSFFGIIAAAVQRHQEIS